MLIINRYRFTSTLFAFLFLLYCLIGNAQDKEHKKPFQEKSDRQKKDPSVVLTQDKLDHIAQSFSEWMKANEVLQRSPELWQNKTITPLQITMYGKLKAVSPDIKINFHERNGTPIFISGSKLGTPPAFASPQTIAERNSFTARAFLQTNSSLLKISEASNEFKQIAYQTDDNGRAHIRYQQVYHGLDVWGKEIYVHVDRFGNVDLFNGRYEPTPSTVSDINTSVSEADAIKIAIDDVSKAQELKKFSEFEQDALAYNGPSAKKIIFCDYDSGAPHLAYIIEVRPNFIDWLRYFVDAKSGNILFKFNNTCLDGPAKATAVDLNNVTRTIDTYQHNNQYYMIDASRPMFNAAKSVFPDNTVGTIWTIDARNTDLKSLFHVMSANNTWTDKAAVSAHYNGAITYEYFRQTHNRNSIDGQGSTIMSAIHVTQNGQPMDNAFWNGRMISYGDGNVITTSWPGALDGAAHEMTHGVTEHTAGLEYLFQSGALNESFSDIFACMVDRDDWRMFEDITIQSQFPTGALRDLVDPHNGGTKLGDPGWQPAHMNEYLNFDQSRDNGGVHYNSGIPNKAANLIATAITRDKAEKIAYCALTTKLTKQSQFIDCRLAMVKCAEEIYGANSAEAQAVKNSYDQVGITDGGGTKKPDDVPPVSAGDKMLITSTDPNDPFYLWIATPPATNPNDFKSLTQTEVIRKPSIADDGSIAVFVDGSNNLRAIAVNPAAPLEQILDNTGIWNNVSLSRDAKLLSATTTLEDASMFLFDVSTTTVRGKKITLTTPSYSDTPVPNSVVYADAMEFTFDKQYMLYDSFNEVNISGVDFAFWEINLLNVWDKAKNDFGSGKAQRMFPFEPGLSLGNPSMARTKSTVFTFEKQNPTAQTTEIMAVDINSGDVKKVGDSSFPQFGYPTYSGDDKIISFGKISAGKNIILNVAMGNDGISASGSAVPFISDAKFPVWFRQGKRPVSVESNHQPDANQIVLTQNYPNPFLSVNGNNATTQIGYSIPKANHVRLTIYDALGREIARLVNATEDAGTHLAEWNGKSVEGFDVPAGMYFYRLTAGTQTLTMKMLITK